jgi:hypothetical protein
MTTIPTIDLPISDKIIGKKVVIYTTNNKGEFPNSFMKVFIPSSIPIDMAWYVGYTPFIIDGFNMVEIPDIIAEGLQSFNIVNGSFKRYNQYNVANPNNDKLEIIMSESDLIKQLNAKKFLIQFELIRIYDNKIKELYTLYGSESDTWTTQLSEAKEYTKDQSAIIPFITNVASIRGIKVDDLVKTILQKAEVFTSTISTIIGNKQLFSDRVEAASNDSELISIINELSNV